MLGISSTYSLPTSPSLDKLCIYSTFLITIIIMFSKRYVYFCQITNHFVVERNLFKRTKPSPQQYASNISCGLCNNTIFHYRLDYNVNTMTLSKIKGKQTLMRVGRLNMGTLMSTSVEMLLSIVHALTRAPPVSFLTVVRRESMRIGWTSLVYFSISKIQCLRY